MRSLGSAASTLVLAALVLLGCRREPELPYVVRDGLIIPPEHAELELPLTVKAAEALAAADPQLELELRSHSYHPMIGGKVRSMRSSEVDLRLLREGELAFRGRYDHDRFVRGELYGEDQIRVFDSVHLDYGGDQLLAEVERVPLGPDQSRGEPVPRDIREQFDPLPLYRHYFARRDTPEWRAKVVASYIDDFAPRADPAEVEALLARAP